MTWYYNHNLTDPPKYATAIGSITKECPQKIGNKQALLTLCVIQIIDFVVFRDDETILSIVSLGIKTLFAIQ